jgi:DNA processing protein
LTPAPLPQAPLDAAQRLACLRLIRSDNVGPVTFRELINHFGGAEPALAALPELSRRGGRQSIRICPEAQARAELDAADRIGARPLFTIEPGYPPALAAIDAPPPLLYVKGDAAHLTRPMVAIVGARNGSAAGQKLARMFAARIGRAGYVIASGLARGIDAAAHEASLEQGTVAVLAGGLDNVYPPEHAELQRQIGERGCLISENAPGFAPSRAGLPPPQPHQLRGRLGRADRRGGAAVGDADHGAYGRRAGSGGVRHPRPSARSPGGRHQPPVENRSDDGHRARGCHFHPCADAARAACA